MPMSIGHTWWMCSSMSKDDRDHDANIINLFNVAQKQGLIFNSSKCSIKKESMTFFCGMFSANGYSPDPEKIQGITEMTPPQTKKELQSFLGAVNYLQTFVPHLSHHTEPLHALLKKENNFTWDENSNTSFQKIKSLLQKALLRTPQVLWQKQTSHPPVWCYTQGTQSLHHPRWPFHSFCEQVSHQTQRHDMPTSRGKSWPLCMAVKSSTLTCMEEHSWLKQTTNRWRW